MPIKTRETYISMASTSPSKFLNIGEKPIMIDEWRHVRFLWDQGEMPIFPVGH